MSQATANITHYSFMYMWYDYYWHVIVINQVVLISMYILIVGYIPLVEVVLVVITYVNCIGSAQLHMLITWGITLDARSGFKL